MKRIQAVDVLRGATLAGMLLVNNPGDWGNIYAPLRHAEWIGLTPTDLVFPFFMFIMGMTTGFARHIPMSKILRRTVVIFLLGVLCNCIGIFYNPHWSIDNLRYMGVLQRLALCYAFVAMMSPLAPQTLRRDAMDFRARCFFGIGLVLLVAYSAILLLGNGFVNDGTVNIIGRVDQQVFGLPHMYNDHGIDPEGIISTMPCIVHTMIGYCVGRYIVCADKDLEQGERLSRMIRRLMRVGGVLVVVGMLVSIGLPLNKKIWSPSFVFVTCGLASLLLALFVWLIDVRGCKRWGTYFEAFGINPLVLYVVGDLMCVVFDLVSLPLLCGEGQSIHDFLMAGFQPLLGLNGASLAYALVFNVSVWAIALPLYVKRVYIKV